MPVIIFPVDILDMKGIYPFFDNVNNAHSRIERGIRILEYKLEFGAHAAEAVTLHPDQLQSVVAHTSRSGWNKLQDALPDCCFPAAGFAYQRQRLSTANLQ